MAWINDIIVEIPDAKRKMHKYFLLMENVDDECWWQMLESVDVDDNWCWLRLHISALSRAFSQYQHQNVKITFAIIKKATTLSLKTPNFGTLNYSNKSLRSIFRSKSKILTLSRWTSWYRESNQSDIDNTSTRELALRANLKMR